MKRENNFALKKENTFIYWAPRILTIIFILFLMMFSLDVFSQGSSLWNMLAGFLINNIPAFVLTAVLVFAWKKELAGAIFFISAGTFYLSTLIGSIIASESGRWAQLLFTLPISAPAFIIGILFYIGWRKKGNQNSTNEKSVDDKNLKPTLHSRKSVITPNNRKKKKL